MAAVTVRSAQLKYVHVFLPVADTLRHMYLESA